jgi:peptidoglycan/xylan/chitin deacetylase (PgdA/CDA1 family)
MSKAIILMYHNIGQPPAGVCIPNLYVTPRMFRFQMGYLRLAGYRVLPLPDLLASVAAGNARDNMAAITFDDGYRDFYEHAYPILKRYSYPSTVYVVTGLMGQDNAWDSANDITKPMMDLEMIREISRNGVEIGSHTVSHPQLTSLSAELLRDELQGSKHELEKQLNREIVHFCYPYGDFNAEVTEAVRKAGYQSAVTTRRGHVVNGIDSFLLPRIPIKLITNPISFLYKIHTDSEMRKGQRNHSE